MKKSELKNIITEVIKQSYEKTKKDNSNKKYQGDPEKGNKILDKANPEKGNKILDKANPENVAKILRGEKPVYENDNLDSYNNLQKEVLNIIMKGDIEIQHFPNFKLSKKENEELINKGLKPDEIFKLTSGKEYLKFKIIDLELQDQIGKNYLNIPLTKEIKNKFKDIPNNFKYNTPSNTKKSKYEPDERSSD